MCKKFIKKCKKCFKKCNKMIKKMKWQDMVLVKVVAFFFALMVANLWRRILELEWYIYGIVAVAAYAILWYRMKK